MFIGHYAVALAARPMAPRVNAGWLVAATSFIDLLWPLFLLAGWEHVRIEPGNTAFTPLDFESYPISHSLAGVIGWAVLFGVVVWLVVRSMRGAMVCAALVVSHWVLDLLTHRPDLPLYPGGPKVGLGLWNSVPATLAVEIAMFVAGVWIYARSTTARDRTGTLAFWAFVVFLTIIYAANVFGPPPPNVNAIAWAAAAAWILPFWAAWFDVHRNFKTKNDR